VETTGSGAVPTAACGRIQQTRLQAFAGAKQNADFIIGNPDVVAKEK